MEIVNRVANSGLITLDLEEWLPKGPFHTIDLKDILWQGLILRENDLKEYLDTLDYSQFKGSFLNVHCSEDVILPQWLYTMLSSRFTPHVSRIVWGSKNELYNALLQDHISQLDLSAYTDQRIIIKGCSNFELDPQVYINLVNKIQPVVKSLMYGEACSTVPIYKRPKA